MIRNELSERELQKGEDQEKAEKSEQKKSGMKYIWTKKEKV